MGTWAARGGAPFPWSSRCIQRACVWIHQSTTIKLNSLSLTLTWFHSNLQNICKTRNDHLLWWRGWNLNFDDFASSEKSKIVSSRERSKITNIDRVETRSNGPAFNRILPPTDANSLFHYPIFFHFLMLPLEPEVFLTQSLQPRFLPLSCCHRCRLTSSTTISTGGRYSYFVSLSMERERDTTQNA